METLTPELIRRAISDRDAAAMRLLVRLLIPILRARITLTLVRYGGAGRGSLQTDVDDFVQEVMMRLLSEGGHRLLSWESERSAATTWFGIIAQRITLDLVRVKRSNPYFEQPTDVPELDLMSPTQPDHGSNVIDRELLRRVGERLRAELSDRDRVLFELSIVADEDDERVRDVLGISRDALYQARRRLRIRLEQIRKEMVADTPVSVQEPQL
ncbi:MAG: hypothetical protein HUU55_11650 [Myxococcales bacterium]|nr:hypothetical protein [Myxococcales bacterium]